MISLWEQQSLLEYDVIIVGAGITGLSTAASLKEKNPALNLLIIERSALPSGASTKNAGFACFGSIAELAGDQLALGDEGMVRLVKKRWSGLKKTAERLGEKNIGLLRKGGYELVSEKNLDDLNRIESINKLLADIFEDSVFSNQSQKIKDFKFGNTSALIFNQFEAQLDTGELIKSLWKYCSQLGIHIITGTEVTGITDQKVLTASYNFKAKAVAVCTNAFTNSLLKEKINLKPGRGMVLLVKPKSPTDISGTFHYDEGYYYFRDYHGKLIFGGGRNLALEEEATTSFGINPLIEEKLICDLKEIILPNQDFEIEMKWSGIMAFGPNKEPVIGKTADLIYMGVRLGGMGVALGSMVGEELAELILQDHF
ncbi:MAG: glycine/D-amino acid oxidase-like deaminating enzyme [Marinoscillum sp.]|jgi:glycine/D-amino acid oxidase-like deaminating enzyme